MADDPNKRHHDRHFLSSQQHEYDYFKAQIKREFPLKTDDQIAEAIYACRQIASPSEGRLRLLECVRARLRS